MWISLAVAAISLAADQLSKQWVTRVLQPVGDIPLWDGVFHLTYARNIGAAFSMLEGQLWFFVLFTLAASVAILYVTFRYRNSLPILLRITLGLILGGAVGNLIDRLLYGYVIDFLYFKLINFAIFNIADCCVVIGSILLGIYILFFYDKEKGNKEASHGDGDTLPASDRE